MIYTIKNGIATVRVNSLGAELISFETENGEYVWQGGIWKDHAPLLFPACGRIANNTYTYSGKEYHMGIHGFARTSEFSLVEASEDRILLSISDNDATLESFPFRFTLLAEFKLVGDTLAANFTVRNDDDKTMLFMLGWHPGFNLFGDYPIESYVLDFGDTNCLTHHPTTDTKFISGAMTAYPLEGGKYTLSEEEIYRLDALIFSDTLGKVKLCHPESPRSVEVTWSDNIPYVAFWKWAKSDVRYLCIEPWSGLPGDGVTPEVWENRLNTSLPAGKSEVFKYTVKCK